MTVFSIYDATDGVLFDGSPTASAWLREHGYDEFQYGPTVVDLTDDLGGRLLDTSSVHPRDQDSAVFFASLVANALRPVCPGDVNDDGLVDFADLLAIYVAWGPCAACPGDLNGDANVTILDVLTLLANWGPCPD